MYIYNLSSSNLQDEIHLMVWSKMCFHLLWYALYPGIFLAPSFQLKPSNKSIHVFLSEAQNDVQKCFEENHSSCFLMKCFVWQLTEFWLHAQWLPSVQVKHLCSMRVQIEQKTQVMSHTTRHCWPAAINLSIRSVWGYFQAVVWLTLITVYHLALTHSVVATGACKGLTFSTMKAPQTRQDLDARAFLILVLTVSSPWNDQ